jgi:hypothetical protein
MQKGTKLALLVAVVPFITLVFALPFVNRVEPMILGFPFILFWIVVWVLLTPPILLIAYMLEKKFNVTSEDDK